VKDLTLAIWLEQSLDRIAPAGGSMGSVICEGILGLVNTGKPDLLRSVLSGVARSAVAVNQPIGDLLADLHTLKVTIFERLEEELDPGLAWEMLLTLENIFKVALTIAVDSYVAALVESHQAQLVESARVHQHAEQQVLKYTANLARANRELARLEKAKTDFISIAAHELKTPLSVVVGYVNILDEQRERILENNADAIFNGIINGTKRLANIIDDLLDISALETNSMALHEDPVAVGSLVKTVVERIKEEAKVRQHQFNTYITANLPNIMSDSQRLYQVLSHLVNNAVKYTPDGGQIDIRVYLESDVESEANCIKIEISDTGIGIAPEDREHIFDKFYRVGESNLHSSGRVKFKGAGPGLGLSIAKGIIEALNGQIWVESPGYDEANCPGSTFHIRLSTTEPVSEANRENIN
jgi:signal transduction histidine kinase